MLDRNGDIMLERILLFITLSSNAFSTTFLNDHYINPANINIKSWKALRDFNIVKQDLDFSCGAASIATMLNNFYSQNLTESDILDEMGKDKERASFEDMQRAMPKFGFQAKGYALPFEQLVKLKIPVIVYLKYRKNDHFSVLRGINSDTVLLSDPSLGHISMSKSQFLSSWETNNTEFSGKILAIVPNDKTIEINHLFFTNTPERITKFSASQIKNSHLK